MSSSGRQRARDAAIRRGGRTAARRPTAGARSRSPSPSRSSSWRSRRAIVHSGKVSRLEADVFHAINDLPGLPASPSCTCSSSLGILFVPLVVAIVAAMYRKWWLTLCLVLVIPLKLFFEKKVIKEIVDRQRPGTSICHGDLTCGHFRGDVSIRGESFVSGHAIITGAVATLLFFYLGRTGRIVVIGLAVMNGVARVYLGRAQPARRRRRRRARRLHRMPAPPRVRPGASGRPPSRARPRGKRCARNGMTITSDTPDDDAGRTRSTSSNRTGRRTSGHRCNCCRSRPPRSCSSSGCSSPSPTRAPSSASRPTSCASSASLPDPFERFLVGMSQFVALLYPIVLVVAFIVVRRPARRAGVGRGREPSRRCSSGVWSRSSTRPRPAALVAAQHGGHVDRRRRRSPTTSTSRPRQRSRSSSARTSVAAGGTSRGASSRSVVGFRIVSGTEVPVDLVLAVAIGWAVGAIALLGVRRRRPTGRPGRQVADALAASGIRTPPARAGGGRRAWFDAVVRRRPSRARACSSRCSAATNATPTSCSASTGTSS